MPIVAGATTAGSGLGQAFIGGKNAKKAAQMQADAINRAMDMQWNMYQQQREDQRPWREAGVGALAELGNADFRRDFTINDFNQDPGYAFRMAEGMKALERSAAARGGLQSGAFAKAIAKYGQDYASNEYQNAYNRFNADRDRRFNRLSSLAGIGQTANSQLMGAGQNYANAMQGNLTSLGANSANSLMAQSNALSSGLGSIGNAANSYAAANWMQQFQNNQASGNGGMTLSGLNYANYSNTV